MELRPISIRAAMKVVTELHRHLEKPQGAKLAIAAFEGKQLVGVGAGRLSARAHDDAAAGTDGGSDSRGDRWNTERLFVSLRQSEAGRAGHWVYASDHEEFAGRIRREFPRGRGDVRRLDARRHMGSRESTADGQAPDLPEDEMGTLTAGSRGRADGGPTPCAACEHLPPSLVGDCLNAGCWVEQVALATPRLGGAAPTPQAPRRRLSEDDEEVSRVGPSSTPPSQGSTAADNEAK